MKDSECVEFLQWALPQLRMRWPGFRKVRKQVCKRIDRRRREIGLADVPAYRRYLETHRDEWSVLDGFCRISISRFYRDRGVFDYLGHEVLPMLAAMAQARGDQSLRCWSAGCASGEEAYTLTILWKLVVGSRFPDLSWHVTATDSDPHLLARARRGCYAPGTLQDCPQEWMTAAFRPAGGLCCVQPKFRDGIEFVLQDLRSEMPEGPFHLVLCRHLAFTYFDAALQQKALSRLLANLLTGGILVTGKQEPLPVQPVDLVECHPHLGIYRKTAIA